MKRLGIDARLINQTGVGVYTKNLLKNLEQNITDFEVFVYLRKEDSDDVQFENSLFIKRIANYHWHSINEQVFFLRQLLADNLNVMHFTYFSHPILYKRPFVITIHDVIPLTHGTGKASTHNPLIYSLKKYAYEITLRSGVHNSKAIITPSQTVKNEIIEMLHPEVPEKIYVTYEGVNEQLIKSHENTDLAQIFPKPFFIYIGNFYPHKNVEALIKAFTHIKTESELILIGPQDFFSKKIHRLVQQLQSSNVTFFHNPSPKDFVFFYSHAQALIHPSKAEGFGLPLIEASYFKCPIIASDIPVFNEILGNNFIKFNPARVDDIALKISEFMKKKTVRQKLYIQPDRFDAFSFASMSFKTLNVYKSLL